MYIFLNKIWWIVKKKRYNFGKGPKNEFDSDYYPKNVIKEKSSSDSERENSD